MGIGRAEEQQEHDRQGHFKEQPGKADKVSSEWGKEGWKVPRSHQGSPLFSPSRNSARRVRSGPVPA